MIIERSAVTIKLVNFIVNLRYLRPITTFCNVDNISHFKSHPVTLSRLNLDLKE
jgi:hypothetical protein